MNEGYIQEKKRKAFCLSRKSIYRKYFFFNCIFSLFLQFCGFDPRILKFNDFDLFIIFNEKLIIQFILNDMIYII
jgi:hypothetical protein